MNHGILVARTQQAIAEIEAQTRRLGGELIIQPVRGDVAHRQLHTLEAIAKALEGIGVPDDATEPSAPAGPTDVEPVEAVITVVKEPPKLAAKGKDKK